MRSAKILVLAALAAALPPAGAAGQEATAVQADSTLRPSIDPRLLVPVAEQRAAAAGAVPERVVLDARRLRVNGLIDYVLWGMVPGAMLGLLAGGAAAEDDLSRAGAAMLGGTKGAAIGAGVGGIVYAIRRR